ncbi:hypothetical protein BDZ90DRAFT_230421 [Jaminaea rosea]|uniref:1-phosphatidylinositol-3-phosphate 5-kinase n=1 Tax=Jaminaea rosea TaxID=1569628 RepID=A0A316V056_9BASI|nr:hypothetical protein BDZ90DRAFT_230421 [Jaminaea rosea]PWN29553.1 hypothetical protein BDZ90DRAFT_230421 [Jaminaea rosea]
MVEAASRRDASALTSFGFLGDDDEAQQSGYGFGNLLTSLKTVFSSSHDSAPSIYPEAGPSRASSRNTSSTVARKQDDHSESGASRVERPQPPTRGDTGSNSIPASTTVSSFSSSIKPPAMLPGAVKTAAPAPAVLSTIPTHVLAGLPRTRKDSDARSTTMDTGYEDDALGELGLHKATPPLHHRDSRSPWASVPGFPLPQDILADDAQSIRTASSHLPASDGASGDLELGNSASTSLQMSAEAFRRLMMSGGAAQSKEWWMPDASAKECSSCGSAFTIARRRHHCRCCGQIFCAKCASNLLPGAKLGLRDVVRVCNFCTKMLRDYERARAGQQVVNSRAGGSRHNSEAGRVRAEMISAPLEAAVENAPQGKFAANALFGASALGRSITASAESSPQLHRSSSLEQFDDENFMAAKERSNDSHPHETHGQAPFRRDLAEEDRVVAAAEGSTADGTTRAHGLGIDSPTASPILRDEHDEEVEKGGTDAPKSAASKSSVAFPTASAGDDGQSEDIHSRTDARHVLDEARARLASDTTLSHDNRAKLVSEAALRAFRRSRLRSRVTLEELRNDEDLDIRPSSRLGGGAHELSIDSYHYLRRLCAQSLEKAKVVDADQWLDCIVPLTLKVVQHIRPVAHTNGNSMGVRRYVKIKRIPGGALEDCHLASGYICAHNVASKAMLRRLPLKNARVLLLSFSLTAVKGEGQYVSLDALSASEREYTRILVARVLSLRPHLLVVRDQVSRLALELLEHAGVIVVWKVPESSMAAIARVTQADIVSSVDRLALRPRLGRCGTFAVDTFHSGSSLSKRRSFLRFGGTAKQLGCSIVLRGGNKQELGKVKTILELMLLAAHNLRLEESMRETTLSLLPAPKAKIEQPTRTARVDANEEGQAAEAYPQSLDSTVSSALKEFDTTLLSISAAITVPAPYPLVRLQKEATQLEQLEKEVGGGQEEEEEEEEEQNCTDPSATTEKEDVGAQRTAGKPDGDDKEQLDEKEEPEASIQAPKTPIDPEKQDDDDNIQCSLDTSSDIGPQLASILPSKGKLDLKTRHALARSRHDYDAKYILRTLNDDALKTPFAHQKLSVLHVVVSSATMRPCFGPQVEQIEFYGPTDSTLADYLDAKCAESSLACKSKGCSLQRILHYESFVHYDVRVQVFCERFVCPIAGQENSVLTWEYCKQCEAATPVSVVHEEAKAYSWAKFLEAHFYTLHTVSECSHDRLTERIRYFAYKNLAFRIHVEELRPFEVVVPGLRLFTRPDIQAGLRSEEALGLAGRADSYFHSVAARLKALEHEISLGREGMAHVERFRPHLEEIRQEALNGRKQVNRLFVSVVKSSTDHDTLCLNQVRRLLQDLVVTVDRMFASLEKSALPKERDVRRLTASHLSRLFAEKETMEGHKASASMTEPSTPALPPAAEVDETAIAQALPSQRSENSVAALAQLAESAALGLAPQLGLGIEDYSSPVSGASTPMGAIRHGSERSSRQASRQTSALPTPTKELSEAAATLSSSPEHVVKKAVEGPAREDSDGNSSPTTRLRPTLRSKHSGKSVSGSGSSLKADARPKTWRTTPSAITDSSCTEAGDVTDSSALVSSLISRFDPKTKVRGTASRAAETQSSSSSSQVRRPQRVLSDGGGPRNPPSRPTSPGQVQRPSRANLRALHSSSSTSTVPTLERAPSASSRRAGSTSRGPPSSYRPPIVRPAPTYAGRGASESESDAANGLASRRQFGMTSINSPRTRPSMSRRTSAKSDSGNESSAQQQHQQRTLRRRVASPGPSGVATPRTPLYGAAAVASRLPMPTGTQAGKSRVSTIARHFDRINREAEREREKQRRAMALRARRALPISASTARVAQYSSVTAAVESDDESSDGNDNDDDDDEEGGERTQSEGGGEADSEPEEAAEGAESISPESRLRGKSATVGGGHTKGESEATIKGEAVTPPATGTLKASNAPPLDAVASPAAAAEQPSSKLIETRHPLSTPSMSESFATEKGSLLKTISSLWASRPGASLPLLEYPLTGEQHLFADSPLLLREDEPSSTIAFTLVSSQYQERLGTLRAATSSAAPDTSQVEASLRRQEGVHLRFDFESGASRFHCRILFAEQFDALRRCCGCQSTLISSLARCVKWDSSGGKSGMTFLKTRDDRLVLKQLSASELTGFSTFAPHYFAHMAECLMHGKPTTLAKIFGLYRISMRNQATGRSYKLDVLVMENLFYGRKCSRIFDLKGSMRNRYVKETGAAGEVLLDENLVEISLQRPLYIRESSKVLIRQALKHDSDFLAAMNIMDYSVIVGLDTEDDENRELVVGIIDFLRSYTWDKRVETFVKEQSSLLVAAGGSKGELPTVITPKQYANRFLSFLDGILLLSPDSWYKGAVGGGGGMMGGTEEQERQAHEGQKLVERQEKQQRED